MSSYVLQVNRVAKPGHSKDVLDLVTTQFEKGSGSRNVSISAFASTGSGHLIVGARVLDSIEKVEEISDNLDREQSDRIDSHCNNVQVEMLRESTISTEIYGQKSLEGKTRQSRGTIICIVGIEVYVSRWRLKAADNRSLCWGPGPCACYRYLR